MEEKMTKNNLLANIGELGLAKAQSLVLAEALKRLSMEELKSFENKYKQVLKDYTSDTKLAFSSNSFDVQKLGSFKTWSDELVIPEQREKYILLIINKMLEGDPIAYSLYSDIYKRVDTEKVLTHDKIMQDAKLKDAYLSGGAGVGDHSALQAEYWLTTNEAHDILCLHQYHSTDTDLLLSSPC